MSIFYQPRHLKGKTESYARRRVLKAKNDEEEDLYDDEDLNDDYDDEPERKNRGGCMKVVIALVGLLLILLIAGYVLFGYFGLSEHPAVKNRLGAFLEKVIGETEEEPASSDQAPTSQPPQENKTDADIANEIIDQARENQASASADIENVFDPFNMGGASKDRRPKTP